MSFHPVLVLVVVVVGEGGRVVVIGSQAVQISTGPAI